VGRVALPEFALIERYFRNRGERRPDVMLGVGDDAALLLPAAGDDLVAAIDTLVEGVHFPPDSPAASIGHRALAVNLSDLAAMGARAAWALLALTLPRSDEAWLEEFTAGFASLARAHRVALVGGDTTRGPLTVTVAILGHVAHGTALTRGGGRAGDALFVSGTPGDAAAGLALELGDLAGGGLAGVDLAGVDLAGVDGAYLRDRFRLPTPRLALGERLRGYASACIDVSDGLLADAGKLAAASGVGVELAYAAVPLSDALLAAVGEERAHELAFTGGDDYELCFAVHAHEVTRLVAELPPQRWGYTRIGVLREGAGASVLRDGTVMEFSHSGYEHFT
jgi:thiamine-monophosphate kinase